MSAVKDLKAHEDYEKQLKALEKGSKWTLN